MPAPEVAAELSTRAALVIDLRLCTSEALSAICVLLREAPGGIRQVVLRDGLTTLGADSAYRDRVAAYRRRAQSGALSLASLRMLMTALAAFMTVRGSRLAVLDLAGAPLGQEVASLVTPLSRALRDCRARQLRWLGLSGCKLGDRGLAMLLPWLAGKEKTLPHLEALTLASNGLADVRLVDVLLRTRARLCFERKAASLQLVDLSGNPHLGDGKPTAPGAAAQGSARRRGGQQVPRLGTAAMPQGRRGALVRAAACAIAEGLPLRVLRLRRTRLDEESLQPLLQLMQAEKQRCLSSNGALAGVSGFCLEELDISENGLEPSFSTAVAEGLKLLRAIREGLRGGLCEDPLQGQGHAPSEQRELPPPQPQQMCRRAQSAPCCSARAGDSSSRELPQSAVLDALARDAMSDGEEYLRKANGVELSDGCPGPCPQAFLLRRAEDKRKFRSDARELSSRRPAHRSQPQEVDASSRELGMEMWAEAPLAVAGALGPTAAQSMVRQAVWEELRACAREAANTAAPASAGTTPCLNLPALQIGAARQLADISNSENRQPCPQDEISTGSWKTQEFSMEDENAGVWKAAASHVSEQPPSDLGILWHTMPQPVSPTSSDEEAEAEAQLLRVGRLEELRADILGTLGGTTEAYLADLPDQASLQHPTMSLGHAQGGALHGSELEASPRLGSFLDVRLDEMHREALADLHAQRELS